MVFGESPNGSTTGVDGSAHGLVDDLLNAKNPH